MPAAEWTQEADSQLRAAHAAGTSLHAISQQIGIPKSTLSRHAKALGLTWDRTKTAAATEAVVVDNKARRQKIVARMYGRIEYLQDRLDQVTQGGTWRTLVSAGKDGDEVQELTFVPILDERNTADTLYRYVAAAGKLEAVDVGDRPAKTRDLLRGLGEHLGIHDAA